MNRKTKVHLILHILICISGMLTAIFGFAEIFGNMFIENVELPLHIAIVVFISGMFTFIVAFTHGLDYKTWERLKDES